MECIFGVDAGGTKCSAIMVRTDGRVLGRGRYAHPGVTGRSLIPIVVATRQAIGEHRPETVHLGLSCSILPPSIISYFGDAAQVTVDLVGEETAAFRLADEDCGIIVLAGTGAFIHVVDRQGRQLRLDGRGPLIGDFGSGFYIGQKALQAAVRAHFHERHQTSLAKAVVAILGHAKLSEIGSFYVSYNDRSSIASLASAVDEQARAGDAVSLAILREAADAIAETVRDGVDRFGLYDSDLPLIGTGSVVTNSEIYWQEISRAVHSFAPKLRPMMQPEAPVVGIALQLLRQRFPQDYPKLRANLFASLKDFPEPTVHIDDADQYIPNATRRPC